VGGALKGIILAGGTGSRLDPLTRITNKHLLPVYDRPMIFYAVQQLVDAGIDRIIIVTGGSSAGEFLHLLGNGSQFGLRHLDYTYQDRAGGIGEALGLCEWFAAGDPVAVLLGDNIFEYSLAPFVESFLARGATGAHLILTQVDDPSAYGVAELRDGTVVRIHEKPKVPPSDLITTGFYLYEPSVFEFVKGLRPSARGELEIEDVNNRYIDLGTATFDRAPGYWIDCGGSIDMLHKAAVLVAAHGSSKPWSASGTAVPRGPRPTEPRS
jgi:glucose-1-phosphate thymidylyltransferase